MFTDVTKLKMFHKRKNIDFLSAETLNYFFHCMRELSGNRIFPNKALTRKLIHKTKKYFSRLSERDKVK